jgi:TrmH family RNA methyltransferase
MNAPLITSRQNQHVKNAVQLRQRKWRNERGLFLVDGVREIGRAIDAGVECREAFVCEAMVDDDASREVVERLHQSAAELMLVTADVFEKLAFGDRHDGVVVVAQTPRRELATIRLPENPLVVVVENVEKPGNLGAILRTADATAADAVVVAGAGTDVYNPNTIRASVGTVFRENVCAASSADALDWLRNGELQIVAARPDAELTAFEVDYRRPTALVLGSEAEGLSGVWQGADVTAVRLPMLGAADSLNVSVTAAVVLYEALRQRTSR